MSLINSKNKINAIKLQASKNEENIPRIITVDFDKKPAHYFNYGYRKFNIIAKKTLILTRSNKSIRSEFQFNGINENIIPFIKIIPRFEVFLDKNELYTDILFRHEWNKLSEENLVLKTYMRYKLTPYYYVYDISRETTFNLYYSLDLAVKSRLGISLTHGSQL